MSLVGVGAPGPGEVLGMFRATSALTRADVMARTGLSRSTVNQRIDVLLDLGYLTESDLPPVAVRGRGRPAGSFAFNAASGVLLVCDIGATALRAALCDLAGSVESDLPVVSAVTDGPETVLARVLESFGELLTRHGRGPDDVRGIALSVPGPVDHEQATVVSPPIMTGWDRFDVRAWFAPHFACPVVLEKDANAMAWGEYRERLRAGADGVAGVDGDRPGGTLLLLKLGTGVGSGIIAGGRIHRGDDGAAGDIGHTQANDDETDAPLCRCGNLGCVEARAGGWALLRDMRAAGRDVETVDDVVAAIRGADPLAVQLARAAGRTLGRALSEAVNLLNPRVVVVGGQLAAAEEQVFAGLREMVYARSLPLATRRLVLTRSSLGVRAGSVGLAHLLADHVFAPARIDSELSPS